MPDAIDFLRRDILARYAADIGLDPDARYLSGVRIRPVVPLDTATERWMIIGAYPSARFETIRGIRDVPVGDNLGPFEPERWYDGDRVRVQKSAAELEEHYLKPLGVSRGDCWITDLVKVFLFKDGHRNKYERLGAGVPAGYRREDFETLAERSRPWLAREVHVARPRLVITLGSEVAGVLRGVDGPNARNALLGRPPEDLSYDGLVVPTVHLVHPGILMRAGPDGGRNPWPERHINEHLPMLKRETARLAERLLLNSADVT